MLRTTSTRSTARRVHFIVAVVAFVGLATASCGGGSDGGNGTNTPTTSIASGSSTSSAGGAATTAGPTTAPSAQSIDIGATGYHQGFVWTVNSATFGPSSTGVPTAFVDVSIANPGLQEKQPSSQIALESSGTGYIALSTGMARIDGGGTLNTELEFQVNASSFSLAESSLVLGGATNNQARIAFGPAAPPSLLREPLAAGVTADNAPSSLLVKVSDVTVRWDDPIAYSQTEVGTAYLAVTFSLTSEANSTFAKRNMTLTLPDGSQLEPESAPNSRIDAGVIYEDITAIFVVADPADGDYTFSMTGMIGYAGETFGVSFTVGR